MIILNHIIFVSYHDSARIRESKRFPGLLMNEKKPKTVRTFECRDHLWRLFRFVADDLGCTVDYLVNESMREYARSRGYSITEAMKIAQDETAVVSEYTAPPPAVIHPPESVSYPPRLFVAVNGAETEVVGPKFVIGRGSRMTDLTIADTNISRRHCIIEQTDQGFFISDLGSTNGIEIGGTRVERCQIEHNLCVYICDYELRFYFRE